MAGRWNCDLLLPKSDSVGRRPKWYPLGDLNAYPKVRNLVPYPLDEGGMITGRPGLT